MHALIIEQDGWVVLMIEDGLASAGYTSFDVATTKDEAVACALRRCPDLITSDVRLGEDCGIETVRTICGDRAIPVLFVTSTGWEVRRHSDDVPVVQKPFGTNDVAAAIAAATERPVIWATAPPASD